MDMEKAAEALPLSGRLRRSLFRNTAAGWANNLVSVGSALAVTPMVIDRVGAPAYGIWVLVTQFSGYAGLLDLGVQPAVIKHVAGSRTRGDRYGLRAILSSALVLHSCIACVVLAALGAFSFFFKRFFNLAGVDPAEVRHALLIAGVTAAVGFPASVFSAGLRGCMRVDLGHWLGIAANLSRVVGVLLAWRPGAGIVGLAWAGVAANLDRVDRRDPPFAWRPAAATSPSPRPPAGRCASIMSFGALAFVGTLGWYMAYASDAIVIGGLATPSDIAYFGLAANVMIISAASRARSPGHSCPWPASWTPSTTARGSGTSIS